MLAPSYLYKIKKVNAMQRNVVDATLFANVSSKAEAEEWLGELQDITRTTFSIYDTPAVTGKKIIFKQYRKCHHNTRSAIVNSLVNINKKNTNCPAKLIITIRRELKHEKGRDTHVRGMPCEIHLNWNHNHSIESADALRFRPVDPIVKKKLLSCFIRGILLQQQ